MAEFKAADGIAKLESFMKSVGGEPKEWYVGVSHDAASRLEQHGMQGNSSASWIQCPDEKTAHEIERHFRQSGTQSDGVNGNPDSLPMQVYAFRAPKLTSFREWLKTHAENEGEERVRREKREEWVGAVTRLIEKCMGWLQEADPTGILRLGVESGSWKNEANLGRYSIPVLSVEYKGDKVQLVPVGRNTHRTISPMRNIEVPAEGRVDVTNGFLKNMLYRTRENGKDRWYLMTEDWKSVELNQDTFMAIMEEMLS